jgi:hypothetical protein
MLNSLTLFYVRHVSGIQIVGPIGGFANHWRWLMLLSPEFSFVIAAPKQHYDQVRGPSWPSHEAYVQGDIPQVFDQEIQHMAPRYPFVSVQERMEFLCNHVYGIHRTYNNWLDWEWRWRNFMNQLVPLSHRVRDPSLRTILIRANPQLSFHHYFKFNPALNGQTPDKFMSAVSRFNHDSIKSLECHEHYVIDSEDIYQAELDVTLYRAVTDWLGIEPREILAQTVHRAWYQAQQQAQQDFEVLSQHIHKN